MKPKKPRDKEEKKPFHVVVAEKLISQIENGTAPWQRSWKPGNSYLPFNATTGNPYRGANVMFLMMSGYDDPRWLTYKQAQNMDVQVRRGEKGTTIQYCKFEDEKAVRDAEGKPVKDAKGETLMVSYRLDRPQVFHAVVFNASQIDGMPPLVQQDPKWNVNEAAEERLKIPVIKHDQNNRAFYRPATDQIHMPSRAQFPGANQYYQVAFHEMAHWTGHSSRLNRDLLNNPFGSPEYAREELRAEIASVLVGAEIGFGHEPSDQNAAYVASWVKVLKEDPMEIIRAAGDAQKITKFIGELTREQTQVKQQEKSVKKQPDEQPQGPEKPFKLKVPVQRRFDSLFPATTPREEFATTLENLGFIVKDEHPVMDGKPHRIQVEGDKRGEKAGFYVGYSDGHPAGYAKNNRSGEETRWKAKGYTLSPEQQATLAAEAAAKLRERAKVLQAKHEAAALRIEKKLETAHSAERVPYLEHKQVLPGRDVYALDKTLLVPGYDASGKVRTAQYINEDGVKRYAKDSQKEGCFHVFNGFEEMSKRPAIVIAEGYATAATISEALDGKAAVVSAFDAGNLPMVASAIQGKFPGKPILIAADDDHGKRTNPGQAFARKAAEAIGAIVISPVFAPGEQAREPARYSDFNDMKVNSRLGMDAVKSQLEAGLDKAMEKRQDKEWEQPVRVLKYEEAER